MLSWLALYHPLILGAFIPLSPKLGPLDCLCAQALLQNMLFSKSIMCFVQACLNSKSNIFNKTSLFPEYLDIGS